MASAVVDIPGLISKLTLEDKILLLAGKSIWETPEIERVGIPSLKVSDGPNGARGGGFFDGTTAACFPACVSLASTFDRSLANRVGVALGEETQTKGAYVLLGPTVCLHRSPVGGRNFEAFSEDPLLSGILAAEYVKGLQSQRVSATVKHFVANEQETRRFTVNQTISNRALRELYLRAFEIVVKQADPWAIMTSYPKINGRYVDAQPTFVKDVLRDTWGYKGLVMSDWGALSNHVESIKYGIDLEMPGPAKHRSVENVQRAVKDGLVTEQEIEARTTAMLEYLAKLGKFSDRKTTPGEQAIDRPEHRSLIREAGGEGIVLLKNRDKALPINIKDKSIKKVALLGPLAKYAAAHGGGSASLNCHYKVSPYEAFTQRLGSDVELTYCKGAHIFRVYPDLEQGTTSRTGTPGFTAEFFRSLNCSGEAFHAETAPRGFFSTLMNTNTTGGRSMRYSTTFTPTESGNHYLSFSGVGPTKLWISGTLVATQAADTRDAMVFFLGCQEEHRFQHAFSAGQAYDVVLETGIATTDNADLHLMEGMLGVHLGFVAQSEHEADLLAESVALAGQADLAVCFVGNTAQWETEGQDMASMSLPADGSQDALVAAVAAAQPNTVVVVTTGVPVELPWIDDVAAVLQAWYAGQETGNAILDVVLGERCPSGKLPVSWPKRYEDAACFGSFGLDSFESKQVEYVEGVFVGYRHFDRHWGGRNEVLFPFGYGLSYSSFDISGAAVIGAISEGVRVTATVKNTGDREAAETVQVYLAPPAASGGRPERPPKSLVGFDKVHLRPGETKEVSVTFARDAAAYWDESAQDGKHWKVDAGLHTVTVATSSSPADVKATLELTVDGGFAFSP